MPCNEAACNSCALVILPQLDRAMMAEAMRSFGAVSVVLVPHPKIKRRLSPAGARLCAQQTHTNLHPKGKGCIAALETQFTLNLPLKFFLIFPFSEGKVLSELHFLIDCIYRR